MYGELEFCGTTFMSSVVKDLLMKLLEKTPQERLGASGGQEIKDHQFFADVDWNAVFNQEIPPPFKPAVPQLSDDKETTVQQLMESEFFDDYYLKMNANEPAVQTNPNLSERVQGYTMRSCYASREASPNSSSADMAINSPKLGRKFSIIEDFKTDEHEKLKKLQHVGGLLTNHRAGKLVFEDHYEEIEGGKNFHLYTKSTMNSSYLLCRKRDTGKEYIVKKVNQQTDTLKRQMDILYRLNFHPNMICMRDLFFDDSHVFIVTDFMKVEMLNHIQSGIQEGCYKSEKVVSMIHKLAKFLKIIHNKHITHGNVKPEIIFFEREQTQFHLFRILGISNTKFHELTINQIQEERQTDRRGMGFVAEASGSLLFRASKILDLACFGMLSYSAFKN